MTAILGISAFYHDSAAALVVDGEIVAAAQEERFTRKKHDSSFPREAVAYCLKEAGLRPTNLDYIAFYDKPLAKFERLLETYLAFAPAGFRSFATALPVWLKEKLHLRRLVRKGVSGADQAPLVFLNHHESHAASAFFPSPFDEATILTIDGVGEWTTTALGHGRGNQIELNQHLQFPHSLGLLYSAFTCYCGFRVNSGEYKLMGLAPYGRPIYCDRITQHLIDIKPDGSFWLDMRYFNYCHGLTMTNDRFHQLFGAPPRQPEARLEQIHLDVAASIQSVTEEIMLRIARNAYERRPCENLVMAGGVALNCVANGRLLREGPFMRIWIQPAAGDAGGALGAALFIWHQLLERPRNVRPNDSQMGSFLGPAFSTEEIHRCLVENKVPFQHFSREDQLLEHTAELLTEGKVVGWFQGRMEFGPRALGARSILGDPRSARMQSVMNVKIKFRESFRPFAPAVLAEHANEWFDLEPGQESPYMLLVAQVREERRVEISSDQQQSMVSDPDLCRRVNVVRSKIPAVTHVDYSARVQTVDPERNPRFYHLLRAFQQQTGCPLLVNTSFNVRGEPIVCTPHDAYRCFMATEMEVLILGDYVLNKESMTARVGRGSREEYLARFQPD